MYEAYYKFSAKPFRLTPDPRFLYRSKGHARALAYLRYGLHTGEGFVVVTGEVGAGKTTLMRTLMDTLRHESIMAAQITTTQVDSHDLLRMVASAFNIRSQNLAQNASKSQLLADIEAFLLERGREKKRVLLIIDEAQNLPVETLEELRMLSNIQFGEQAILHCFMLGQGGFQETLRSGLLEQFRQRVLASYHLGPLSQDESIEYIHHRLGLVGWKGDPEITESAHQLIYQNTNGIPRKINTLCDRLFLYGSLEELHKFDEEIVDLVLKERMHEIGGSDEEEGDLGLASADSPSEPHGSRTRTHLHLANSVVDDTERRLLSLEKRLAELEGLSTVDRERLAKNFMLALFPEFEIDIHELLESTRKEGLR